MIHIHFHGCEILHLTHSIQMVLILINQIDIEFFRLKLTLEPIGLVQSFIELIFTSHVLSSPKKLFDHL